LAGPVAPLRDVGVRGEQALYGGDARARRLVGVLDGKAIAAAMRPMLALGCARLVHYVPVQANHLGIVPPPPDGHQRGIGSDLKVKLPLPEIELAHLGAPAAGLRPVSEVDVVAVGMVLHVCLIIPVDGVSGS